jgi:hypothetical protein
MLPRVQAIALGNTLRPLALALGGWACMGACGVEEAGDPGSAGAELSPERSAGGERWSERLSEPTVADLLAALDQPHAVVRERVGPHRLEVTSDFALTPVGEPPAIHPPQGAPVVAAQAIHDQLELRWDVPPEPSAARFALSQSNDHDRGRDVVVVGQTVHVRQAHRPWFHYTRDSDVVELWLDDAQHSVHDAIELAAPRLGLRAATVAGAGLDGGPAVEITLELAEATDAGLVVAGPTQAWRTGAEIQAVQGLVRLDAGSGAWLWATVEVRYALPGADGRTLQGSLQLQAQVAPGSPGTIEAPPESRPLPQRLRYDDEQRRLLDGLAAP